MSAGGVLHIDRRAHYSELDMLPYCVYKGLLG
jgi:hypothetical protein